MKRLYLALLSCLLILFPLSNICGESIARLAVLPFEGFGLSESETRIVTELFETALVKTGVYNVLEQNQIAEIMEAQAFSLSGCTDDSCALEVGQLLSAEIIVLGTVSVVGKEYIANAKIIDVALGKNIKADSVSASDLAELTNNELKTLAYRMAGLSIEENAIVTSSSGEIFIDTDPVGAEVSVNGVYRGFSPILVDKIPLGTVKISVKKGESEAEELVSVVSEDLIELNIVLESIPGRLLISGVDENYKVYLDDVFVRTNGSGLFRDIPAGMHNVKLYGSGMYYEADVQVFENRTSRLSAVPYASGQINLDIPAGVSGILAGADVLMEMSADSTINLPVGNYSFSIKSSDYKPYVNDFELSKGEIVDICPELVFTPEGRKKDFEKTVNREFTDIRAVIDQSDYFDISILDSVRALKKKLCESDYEFIKLEPELNEVYDNVLQSGIDHLQAQLEEIRNTKKIKRFLRYSSFGIGAAGLLTAGVTAVLAAVEMENYNSKEITSDAVASRELLEIFEITIPAGLVTLGAGALGGSLTYIGDGDIFRLKSEMNAMSKERAVLSGGIQ